MGDADAGQRFAEHPSLGDFLRDTLVNQGPGAGIGFASFNQWDFTLAALCDTAIAAHRSGYRTAFAFWADHTPMRDPGWTTNNRLARFLGDRGRDIVARRALVAAGVPRRAFARPPIEHWSPRHPVSQLPEPLTRAAIRTLRYDGSAMGRSILQVHPDRETPVRDDYVWPRGWVEGAVRSYAWVYDQVSEWIRQRDLGAIVVYNGRFTHDQAAAAAAQRLGAQVLYYDAGGIETGFDLTTASTHDWDHLQDRMLRMWDSWPSPDREEIAHRWFLNRQNHSEPGIDVFVGSQEIGHLGSLPTGSRIVAFFSSSGDEIAELDLRWEEFFHSQEQALAVVTEECRKNPDLRLIVRTHPHMRLKPQDDQLRWNAAVERLQPDLHLDANSPVDSYALMRAVDQVFTYGSTAGVESAYLGKPVAVMGPSAYDRLGCVMPITTRSEVAELLQQPHPGNPERSMLYGLMMMRRGFCYESVVRSPDGTPVVEGVPLKEASSKVRKASQALWNRRLRKLLER